MPKAARLIVKAVVPVSGPCKRGEAEQEVRQVADDDDRAPCRS